MSTRAPLLFNPSRASFEELEKTFVGRRPQLDALENSLLADAAGTSTRHWQLIGPRGSGKSHFTELLGRRLAQHHGWAVVRLPEEHYLVANVAELLEQVIIRLEGLTSSPFSKERDPLRVEELALDRLRAWKRSQGKSLLVILENLGMLLERQLPGRRDQSRLREILTRAPLFTLLATATSYVHATVDHGAPFYDFFQSLTLEDLQRKEVIELVEARARWDQDEHLLGQMGQVRPRVDAIFHFSGGNPRLVLALYGVLRHGVTEELHSQLLKLLDEVTPYYQARLRDISPQMERVLAEMALAEGALTPSEIGQRTRMSTSKVTANISKLQGERFIHAGGRPDLKRRYYELTDRLFRLWMQMREGGSSRQKLRFLTEFFQRWYDAHPAELVRAARKVATTFWMELHAEHTGRCSDLLTTLEYLEDAFKGDLDSLAIREIHDSYFSTSLIETDRAIATLERLRQTVDAPSQVKINYALALIYSVTDHPEEVLRVLKPFIIENQTSIALPWILYLNALRSLEGLETAYSTGMNALRNSPSLNFIRDDLTCWAVELGRLREADQHSKEFLDNTPCSHCKRRALRNYILGLISTDNIRAAKRAHGRALMLFGNNDPEIAFFELCIAKSEGKGISPDELWNALESWPNSEPIPEWALQTTVRCFIHAENPERAYDILKTMVTQYSAEHQPSDFTPHILEILVRLRAVSSVVSVEAEAWLMSLHLDTAAVSLEFIALMPRLARSVGLAPHVLDVYRSLRQSGAIPDDIPPYSTANAVQDAPAPDKALMALPPELREATSLLLERQV